MQWPAARLRRVLNAAIASPISAQAGGMLGGLCRMAANRTILNIYWPALASPTTLWQPIMPPPPAAAVPQDLADAEAALQQGFAGSLSRVPTSSSQREARLSEEAGADMQEPAAAAAAGEAEGAEGAAAVLPQHGSADVPATQPVGAAAAVAAGDDTLAAELAAAAAQQEAELMDMVSGCTCRAGWGGVGGGAVVHVHTGKWSSACLVGGL